MQLYVDDGIPSRGHRNNLMSSYFKLTGISCKEHTKFGHMCTIVYAEDF